MDREIPKHVKQKARRKTLIKLLAALALIAAAVFGIAKLFQASITLDGLTVGTVDRGAIAITVGATGKVVPQDEEIVASPISARILEIYKMPGDSVKAGEPLMRLDLSVLENEYRNLLDEEAIKVSTMERQQLTTENSLFTLGNDLKVKEMNIQLLSTDLKNERYLDSLGASTADQVRRLELQYEQARMELDQLRKKVDLEERNAAADLNVQQIELRMFRQTLQEKARQLEDARIFSPRSAVLTAINGQVGSNVSQGAQIAVIADLSRFRIDCEIADGYRDRLAPGSRAIVEAGTARLEGTVTAITPSVLNGVIQFTVTPDAGASQEGIRSGSTATVNVQYGLRDDVLRVPNSSLFAYGPGRYNVLVIEGNKAVRRPIEVGEGSFEYIEVLSGLEPGERVILSKLEKYGEKEEVKIKE